MRFEGEAYLAEMIEEFFIDAAMEMPSQNIAVEQVPLIFRRHPGADTGARYD
ncbi:hypothetical protein D3C87_1912800 [compost metagenome]